MRKSNLTDVNKKVAFKVSIVTIAVNLILAVFKLVAGIVGNSSAMISDSVHSASDIFSTIVVMIGVAIAARPTDRSHPYGHERIECVCSALLAVLLFLAGRRVLMRSLRAVIRTLPRLSLSRLSPRSLLSSSKRVCTGTRLSTRKR